MSGDRIIGDCRPTKQQELLLKAALLYGKDAKEAWEKWKDVTDIDRLDPGSYRMLPLLYNNLRAEGVKHPWMAKFKGVYRRSWYENQLLFHHMAELISSFQNAGIKVLILKGAALSLLYYKDCGARPMDDLDILVPENQLEDAFGQLQKLDWTTLYRVPKLLTAKIKPFKHATHFRDAAGRQLDLHWHLFKECCQPGADAEFWESAIAFSFYEQQVFALDPSDQLLHCCVHGSSWNRIPSLRWIADAIMIFRVAPSIDWERITVQAQKRCLILPLRDSLNYLRTTLNAPIPAEVLQKMNSMAISPAEYREYNGAIMEDYSKGLLHMIALKYRLFLRSAICSHPLEKLVGFLKFLRYDWEVHTWQMPFWMAVKVMRRFRKQVLWYRIKLTRRTV